MHRTELSAIDVKRHEVLSSVERKELKPREAAELMGASYAQAKRLRRRRREAGRSGRANPYDAAEAESLVNTLSLGHPSSATSGGKLISALMTAAGLACANPTGG